MQSLFAQFDASRAMCFKPKVRQLLLAVIESGLDPWLPRGNHVAAVAS